MTKAFIAKRCQELGITESDYSHLSNRQKKQEFAELQKFEKFKICDCPELDQLREHIQPQSLMQRIKGLFGKKNKMLPEGNNGLTYGNPNMEMAPWDLNRFGIDVEKFRQESYKVAQDCLNANRDVTQDEKMEGSINAASEDIDIHGHSHDHF